MGGQTKARNTSSYHEYTSLRWNDKWLPFEHFSKGRGGVPSKSRINFFLIFFLKLFLYLKHGLKGLWRWHIWKFFLIFIFKNPNLAEKFTNLADNLKKGWSPRSSWSSFFPCLTSWVSKKGGWGSRPLLENVQKKAAFSHDSFSFAQSVNFFKSLCNGR